MKAGYIKLYREIQDHDIWEDPACRGKAWVDLLLLASHNEYRMIIKNRPYMLNRGDFVASIRFLQKRWKWGAQKTLDFIGYLEAASMMVKKRNGSGHGSPSVYTIVNYDSYQGNDSGEPNAFQNTSRTLPEHFQNETKNVKNVEKEEKSSSSSGNSKNKEVRSNRKTVDLPSANDCQGLLEFWNSQTGLMKHRSLNGQEKFLKDALKLYPVEEIKRAIGRYSEVRTNAGRRYRDVYSWTLGEFVSRKGGYNIQRFNSEKWETAFRPFREQTTAEYLESLRHEHS